MPGLEALGAALGGKGYVLASFAVVLAAMVPFLVRFERRRPSAQEVALLAALCALAVASRVAFAWVPHFKPMAGIVMITGMALGAPSGFLAGALSALASNFIFGQGPWTPWQMLSFGVCGLVFGLLADKRVVPRSGLSWGQRVGLAVAGGLLVVLVAGPILDTSSLFLMLSSITPEGAAAMYLAGFPVNCIHGAATTVTLLLLANPLLGMIARTRLRHGLGGGGAGDS